jgi:NAD+ synthase
MRLRSTVLLALADRQGAMPLATSNKTVLSLGGALPGDMAGRFNPLRDAYASTVLDLARWRNRERPRIGLGPQGLLIPEGLLETGMIAGGGNGLPPLGELDAILKGLIEHDKSVEQLAADGYARDTVRHIEDLLHRGEALRRQAAPGVKLTALNFGRDRRYPMTHAYRSG